MSENLGTTTNSLASVEQGVFMRSVLAVWAALVVLLLAACGSPASLAGGSSTPEDRDREAGLARPTTAPVLEPPVPPAPSADGHTSGQPQETIIVAGVADAPPVIKLIEDLRQRGIELKPSGESRAEFLADAPGQSYQVGPGWLHLHLYPGTEAASAKQAPVRQGLNNPVADWVAPPHAFQCGQVIAVYFGTDEQLIKALTELCGPQFAGSP